MATIKFEILNKEKNTQIFLRLSVKRGVTPRRKTGKFIDFKNWSTKTRLPKQTTPENKNLTEDLKDLAKFVLKRTNEATSRADEIDGDWLQHSIDVFFNRVSESNQSELITDVIQDMIETAEYRKNGKGGIGLSQSRINSYNSLNNMIVSYQKTKKYKIKDVNIKFANDFLKHLVKDEKYQKNYAIKKIADLKTVCYYADGVGIAINPQLKTIETSKGENNFIIYLTPTELKKIEDADIKSEALNNARKWLLLGCNIGQRGGDLLNLTEDNFVVRNGYNVIELTQQKTGKNVTIPVLQATNEILETGLPYKISLQKLNEHIKEVCKIAELNKKTKGLIFNKETKRKKEGVYPKWQLVTSHICRRSFATNHYGIKGWSTPLIMNITAHSTEKMFLNYIGKNSSDYAQQIADFYTLQAQKEKKEPQLKVVKKASNKI